MRRSVWQTVEYVGLLAGALALAWATSNTSLSSQIDNDAYDVFYRIYRPPDREPQSILLAIDENSIQAAGGFRRLRSAVAQGLELISAASPKVVAVDVSLLDAGSAEEDARLEAAIRKTPNVVMACQLLDDASGWEDPPPRFKRGAVATGHVYLEVDREARDILLQKAAGHDRRWALALQALVVGSGKQVIESQYDLQAGDILIPAPPPDRRLRIRYLPPDKVFPRVTLAELMANHGLANRFAGKTVFLGVTAQSSRDRQQTPYTSVPMAGVEIHANVFETIANRLFLVSAPDWATFGFCVALVAVTGAIFAFLSGWPAYAMAVVVLGLAALAPYVYFTHSTVLPFTQPVSSAGFAVAFAASYQYFIVRKRMLTAEGDKSRYQQAIHFVTHEMRTPLTAIQGSSELIGRYALTEEKRKQMAQLINSESKRLGRMIEIFLSVERVSAGQIELKKEQFGCMELMSACVQRVQPLAERKQIQIHLDPGTDASLSGDRELMEYAFYNLLTNAVKYSPPSTVVSVFTQREGDRLRISVKDQGIGIDRKEVSKIFQKFYRTKKAEQSGEAGTGIGLSIVEQIVTQHGGSIEVTSSPGRGSCFTLVLPTQRVNSMVESK
jgi:signal transduction histidine kinase